MLKKITIHRACTPNILPAYFFTLVGAIYSAMNKNTLKTKQPQIPGFTQGFSLAELMITIAVMAILLAITAPNLHGFLARQELTSNINLLSSSLAYARNEAVNRVAGVVFCSSTNATSCSGSSSLDKGWILFVDKDLDKTFSVGDEMLKQNASAFKNFTMTLRNSATYIAYSNNGAVSVIAEIDTCPKNTAADAKNSRTLTISTLGSTSISEGASCP